MVIFLICHRVGESSGSCLWPWGALDGWEEHWREDAKMDGEGRKNKGCMMRDWMNG